MKRILILSPAKSIAQSKIDFAVNYLSDNGHHVEVSRHAAGQHHYFSGTDEHRMFDFQRALDDDELDVILCSRGGYGSVRILDRLDFSAFLERPKLIMGYSDVTVFHNHVHGRLGLPTVHCSAPLNFEENTPESLISLLNVIEERGNQYEFSSTEFNRQGISSAEVIGGNLAILCSLIGTDSDMKYDGKILFIEDVGEAVYAIDRMMWTLKKAGRLQNLAGLMVGGMTQIKDSAVPFGKSVREVISEAVKDYDYPVCFDFPAGHIADNRAIIFGEAAQLVVADSVTFSQR